MFNTGSVLVKIYWSVTKTKRERTKNLNRWRVVVSIYAAGFLVLLHARQLRSWYVVRSIYFLHFFSAKVYVPRRRLSRREVLCFPSTVVLFVAILFWLVCLPPFILYLYLFCVVVVVAVVGILTLTPSTPRLSKYQPNTSRAASRLVQAPGSIYD